MVVLLSLTTSESEIGVFQTICLNAWGNEETYHYCNRYKCQLALVFLKN